MQKSLMMISVCNPLMPLLQKRLYLKYWKDEVDEVLIAVNGRNDRIRNFIVDLWEDIAEVKVFREEFRQGYCFDLLYPQAIGDVIITMDDDNFVYSRGVIDKYAKLLEENKYSAVGSKGLHAYPVQNAQIIERKLGTVRLNPFLSFWKREIIEKTSKQKLFSTYNFKKDSEIAGIKMPRDGWLDAMGKLSVEYFTLAPNFFAIKPNIENEFVHFEGMSSLYRRFFRELEDTNEEIIIEKKDNVFKNRNIDRILPYWVKYHALYNTIKDDIPFNDYKEKFEKIFSINLKLLGIDIEIVKRESDKMIKEYPNLFI